MDRADGDEQHEHDDHVHPQVHRRPANTAGNQVSRIGVQERCSVSWYVAPETHWDCTTAYSFWIVRWTGQEKLSPDKHILRFYSFFQLCVQRYFHIFLCQGKAGVPVSIFKHLFTARSSKYAPKNSRNTGGFAQMKQDSNKNATHKKRVVHTNVRSS